MILTGVVDAIIFRNAETGYTVLEIETKQGTQTVVGILPPIGEGEQIEVEAVCCRNVQIKPSGR